MALIHCDFYSEALALATSMTVILPQRTRPAAPGPRLPCQPAKITSRRHAVLYLLHGLSDDHTTWQRRTSIERYVENLGLAVVMPAVQRSFYTDTACGRGYTRSNSSVSDAHSAQAGWHAQRAVRWACCYRGHGACPRKRRVAQATRLWACHPARARQAPEAEGLPRAAFLRCHRGPFGLSFVAVRN